MKREEDKIQSAIVQWLQLHNYWFCSIPNEAASKSSGENTKSAMIRVGTLKSMGMRSGAPDLIIFLDGGRLLCIECKAPTGHQSPAQINFESRLKQLQHKYIVVRSLDDICKILNNGEKR